MGGKTYRQGQQDWDAFAEAGVVENEVFFTDDPIITAHAIGKTKDTIGYCWPIDAAVAYTLASAGPDAQLTSKDMVNQYTRMATAMMSGTVGYGTVTDPRVETCGHDMIDGYNIELHDLFCSDGVIKMSKNKTHSKGLKQHMSPDMLELMSFRVSAEWWRNHMHGRGSDSKAYRIRYMALLLTQRMLPIKTLAEQTFNTTKWSFNGEQMPWTAKRTKGDCLWNDDPDKHCGHHDPQSYNGWVMIRKVRSNGEVVEFGAKDENGFPKPVFEKLWKRGKHIRPVYRSWNEDMVEQQGLDDAEPERVILWDRVSRGLGNTIPEKDVIVHINAACRRMTARNFNVIRKTGLRNKATYTWKEWGWLSNLSSWIAQTSKKNRKEHDLVNGWKWTKYNSRTSYGYEIANFKWVPGKVNDEYNSATDKSVEWIDGKAITTYTTPPAIDDEMYVWKIKLSSGYYGNKELPWYWKSKEDVNSFINFHTMLAGRTGGVNAEQRTWDGSTGQELLVPYDGFTIYKVNISKRIEMDMGIDPEELSTAREVFESLMWGSPQEFDEAYALLSEDRQRTWNRPKVENVREEEVGGQAVVTA